MIIMKLNFGLNFNIYYYEIMPLDHLNSLLSFVIEIDLMAIVTVVDYSDRHHYYYYY